MNLKPFFIAVVACVSMKPYEVSADTQKGTTLSQSFQMADIGDHFQYLAPQFQPNQTIRSIDDGFTDILREFFDAEVNFDTENYFDSDFFKLYYKGYTQGIVDILQTPFPEIYNILPLDKPLDLCKSIEIQEFFENFYDNLSSFAVQTYEIAPSTLRFMEAIDRQIYDLKEMNDKRLINPQKNDDLSDCGAILIGSIPPQNLNATPT